MWATLLAQLIPVLVPIVVPVVVAGAKKVKADVPKALLPVAAAALGAASSFIGDFSVATGGVLGLAGVGVREVFDQVTRLFSDES